MIEDILWKLLHAVFTTAWWVILLLIVLSNAATVVNCLLTPGNEWAMLLSLFSVYLWIAVAVRELEKI